MTWPDGSWAEGKLCTVSDFGYIYVRWDIDSEGNKTDIFYDVDDFREDGNFQLILIHPQEMTKDQMKEYKKLCYHVKDLQNSKIIIRYADTPLSMDYLFKNSIDAFELIENGFALELKKSIQ